jgi:CBS domain-containing protein
MATHKVHAVAVTGNGERPIGVVSDLDLVEAAAVGDEEATALQVAASEPLSVSTAEPLHRAAQLMAEHGTSHLVVVDASSGYPSGVLSTLDVATAYARRTSK